MAHRPVNPWIVGSIATAATLITVVPAVAGAVMLKLLIMTTVEDMALEEEGV